MKTALPGFPRSFFHTAVRPGRRQYACTMLAALLVASLMIAGCKDMKKKKLEEQARVAAEQEAMAQAVREHAQRLEALRQQEEARMQAREVPEVIWLSDAALQQPEQAVEKVAVTSSPSNESAGSGAATSVPQETDKPIATTAANASVEPVEAAPIVEAVAKTPDDLFTQLLLAQRNSAGQGDDLTRAMNIAGILSMTDRPTFDPRDLQPLSDPQKQRVEHYFKLTQLLRQQVLSPGGVTHYQEILDKLDALMDEVPLHIKRVELSRSVSSYGVMQPLGTKTFLAGRPVPMIVYVELEHFKAIKGINDKFAVKLAQEMVLYNESDGLAVWREPRVQITDESLNRRRDFFVVQRIELPARLGVGKYLLKITMSDLQGGSIDEATIPIEVVADATLVKKP